jgi:hypothetical protein
MKRFGGTIQEVQAAERFILMRDNYSLVPLLSRLFERPDQRISGRLTHDSGNLTPEQGAQQSAVYKRQYELYLDPAVKGNPDKWRDFEDALKLWGSDDAGIEFIYDERDGSAMIELGSGDLSKIERTFPQLAELIFKLRPVHDRRSWRLCANPY